MREIWSDDENYHSVMEDVTSFTVGKEHVQEASLYLSRICLCFEYRTIINE